MGEQTVRGGLVSALDGFHSTWTQARATFGTGTPQAGADYDASATLDRLGAEVDAATPRDAWSGSAADAYTSANADQARIIAGMAGLDRRLGSYVDESARVVDTGRQHLDSVREWVVAAAGSVPSCQAGEQIKLQIAQRGIAEIERIVLAAHADLRSIGDKIRALGDEYGPRGS